MNTTLTAKGTDTYVLNPSLTYYIVFPAIFVILSFLLYALRQRFRNTKWLQSNSKILVKYPADKTNHPRFSAIAPLSTNDPLEGSDSKSDRGNGLIIAKSKTKQKHEATDNPEFGVNTIESFSSYDILNSPISSRTHVKSMVTHNPTTSTATMDGFLSQRSLGSTSKKVIALSS